MPNSAPNPQRATRVLRTVLTTAGIAAIVFAFVFPMSSVTTASIADGYPPARALPVAADPVGCGSNWSPDLVDARARGEAWVSACHEVLERNRFTWQLVILGALLIVVGIWYLPIRRTAVRLLRR